MEHVTGGYRQVGAQDRCAVFESEGARYVAFGDGRTLPYRSFILESVFALARPYLISPESTVTALDMRQLSGLLGAMLARQSRIPGTVVEVLVKEFLVTTPEEATELGLTIGSVKTKKLEQIIERILIQYGDDSVQELECATVLINSASNVLTKLIEDRRLGGFIEQSSRYVVYDERDPVTGRWCYIREERIMATRYGDAYVRTMDKCFEVYVWLVRELTAYYEKLKPIETAEYAIRPGDPTKLRLEQITDPKEEKEFRRVYKFDLRTRACDTARVVLPASTITNLAMVANGRTFEHLLKRLYSSGNPEAVEIARRLHETLNKVIPKYVKRAETEGVAYWMEGEERVRADIAAHFPELLRFEGGVREVVWITVPPLVADTHEALAHQLAAVYFPHCRAPYASIVASLLVTPRAMLQQLLANVIGPRASRRDRVGRGFEHGYDCTFEVTGNFGIFRDLHRHRMLTQQRQTLNPHLGFTVPADIEAVGLGEEVRRLTAEVAALYDWLLPVVGDEAAQYCVLFGHHIRFVMGFNLREAQHLLELRTIPQGHPDYRRVCQVMHREIAARAPWLDVIGLFDLVDHQDYPWARADAEARQSQKRLKQGITDA